METPSGNARALKRVSVCNHAADVKEIPMESSRQGNRHRSWSPLIAPLSAAKKRGRTNWLPLRNDVGLLASAHEVAQYVLGNGLAR